MTFGILIFQLVKWLWLHTDTICILEECVLFGFQIKEDIFIVLNYNSINKMTIIRKGHTNF